MKKTYIDIRDSVANGNKVIKTLIFKGDISILVFARNRICVIEQDYGHKTNDFELEDNQYFSVRNWGN